MAKHTDTELYGLYDNLDAISRQVQDVTRKYVQSLQSSHEALKNHAHVLETILQAIADGIVVTDTDRRLLLMNVAAVRLLGSEFPADWEQRFSTLYKAFRADGSEITLGTGALAKALMKLRPVEEEVKLVALQDDSQVMWVRVNAAPIRDDDGDVLGGVCVLHDITKDKLAFERIRTLYDKAPCGYHSLDAKGKFLEINETELNWFGSNRDDIVRIKSFQDFVHPNDLPLVQNGLDTLERSGTISDIELRLCANGSERTVRWSSTLQRGTNNRFEMTSCTLFDVSERAALKNERDALAAIIAHDIKNYSIGIAGLVEILEEDLDKPEESLRTLHLLKNASKDCLDLLLNLIQTFRLESKGLGLKLEVVSLHNLITTSLATCSTAANAKEVKLDATAVLSCKQPVQVHADATAVTHVITNLVNNSIKFTAAGGTVEISLQTDNNQAMIKVKDNGPGISEEDLQKIFQPFWKSSSGRIMSTTSGLGLFLSRQLIALHHGELTCTSELGLGSQFTITLPLLPQ